VNYGFSCSLSIADALPHCLNIFPKYVTNAEYIHRGADKSLAQLTSRCILFDRENILFDASLV
jgi:hypothetical protein